MNEQVQNTNRGDESRRIPLRQSRPYAVVYMFIITFLFVLILVAVSTMTRERVEANRRIMRERALLTAALPDEVDGGTSSVRVSEIYRNRVREPEDPQADPLYQVMAEEDDEKIIAYVLHLDGQGFWDRIAGFLALEPDKETIIGVDFYDQNETPGLGAQILTEDFRTQFKGKELADRRPHLELRSAAEETDRHSVHAVTGATQTSDRLEDIITANVADWRGEEVEK